MMQRDEDGPICINNIIACTRLTSAVGFKFLSWLANLLFFWENLSSKIYLLMNLWNYLSEKNNFRISWYTTLVTSWEHLKSQFFPRNCFWMFWKLWWWDKQDFGQKTSLHFVRDNYKIHFASLSLILFSWAAASWLWDHRIFLLICIGIKQKYDKWWLITGLEM
jgi:hypothetical protein